MADTQTFEYLWQQVADETVSSRVAAALAKGQQVIVMLGVPYKEQLQEHVPRLHYRERSPREYFLLTQPIEAACLHLIGTGVEIPFVSFEGGGVALDALVERTCRNYELSLEQLLEDSDACRTLKRIIEHFFHAAVYHREGNGVFEENACLRAVEASDRKNEFLDGVKGLDSTNMFRNLSLENLARVWVLNLPAHYPVPCGALRPWREILEKQVNVLVPKIVKLIAVHRNDDKGVVIVHLGGLTKSSADCPLSEGDESLYFEDKQNRTTHIDCRFDLSKQVVTSRDVPTWSRNLRTAYLLHQIWKAIQKNSGIRTAVTWRANFLGNEGEHEKMWVATLQRQLSGEAPVTGVAAASTYLSTWLYAFHQGEAIARETIEDSDRFHVGYKLSTEEEDLSPPVVEGVGNIDELPTPWSPPPSGTMSEQPEKEPPSLLSVWVDDKKCGSMRDLVEVKASWERVLNDAIPNDAVMRLQTWSEVFAAIEGFQSWAEFVPMDSDPDHDDLARAECVKLLAPSQYPLAHKIVSFFRQHRLQHFDEEQRERYVSFLHRIKVTAQSGNNSVGELYFCLFQKCMVKQLVQPLLVNEMVEGEGIQYATIVGTLTDESIIEACHNAVTLATHAATDAFGLRTRLFL